jgi:hypothetical protein
MNNTEGKLTLLIDGVEHEGLWRLEGETLVWLFDSKEYKIESGDDLSDAVFRFTKFLGKKIFHARCQIKSCMQCKHFLMSGLARDMGRGQRGVCMLHNEGVEVCYLCSDYEEI